MSYTVPLNVGANPITVTITAFDETTTKNLYVRCHEVGGHKILQVVQSLV